MADIQYVFAPDERVQVGGATGEEAVHLMTPGDVITAASGFMRGHGTFVQGDNLHASVAGVVERVNKLVCVRALKTRYFGEVGDVVIGRVLEVAQKRWKVDTNTKLDSVLMLSSVNLPGGELRRRSEEDERMMREYLAEGDLISAEVQSVMGDGSLSLHTRSLKYGKLGQGIMVKVSPSLVKRRKNHFHNLPCGASVILGNNGYIWLSPTINEDTESTGGFTQCLEPVARPDREVIARLHNVIIALSRHNMVLFDTSILYAYEISLKFQATRDLLRPEVMYEIVELTQHKLQMET